MRALIYAAGLLGACIAASPLSAQQVDNYSYDALGRLTSARETNSPVQNDTRSWCYDEEGNRLVFDARVGTAPLACASPPAQALPGSSAPPPPPPPPPSGNNPPVPADDSIIASCGDARTLNVIANDQDADGHALRLVSVEPMYGPSNIVAVSDTSVRIYFSGTDWEGTGYSYVVADSLGASATGQIFATTRCSGGGGTLPLQ